jgi:hypothetical protein
MPMKLISTHSGRIGDPVVHDSSYFRSRMPVLAAAFN